MSTLDRSTPGPRRKPVQERSRQRLQRVVDAARAIIIETGADGLKMNDVAVRAGISIGSLYQYFPDKTSLIGTLAQKFWAESRACVVDALDRVEDRRDLPAALRYLAREYYGIVRDDPAMLDIWSGMQADRVLRELDARENEEVGMLIVKALGRLDPTRDANDVRREGLLLSSTIASAVMLAVSQPPSEGEATIAAFEQLLTRMLDA